MKQMRINKQNTGAREAFVLLMYRRKIDAEPDPGQTLLQEVWDRWAPHILLISFNAAHIS